MSEEVVSRATGSSGRILLQVLGACGGATAVYGAALAVFGRWEFLGLVNGALLVTSTCGLALTFWDADAPGRRGQRWASAIGMLSSGLGVAIWLLSRLGA